MPYPARVKFTSALSVDADSERAVGEVLEELVPELGEGGADLVVLFLTAHHKSSLATVAARINEATGAKCLVGCTAHGVIGGTLEVEEGPALSLTAGRLPGVTLRPFHVDESTLPGPDAGPGAWVEAIGAPCDTRQDFVLLGDPSSNSEALLAGLDFAYPGGTKVGGLASGANGNTLFLGDRRFESGVVGVAVSGSVRLDPLVSQGCRPIGDPVIVTKCHRNMVLELGGRRPTEVLAGIYSGLDERGRSLIERSLQLGIASSGLGEAEPEFLIRNVIGVDPLRGLLAVGAILRPGQTVQFHVRDSIAASEDLHATLERYSAPTPAAGALLFACAGRGEGLFGRANHDSEVFAHRVGPVPVGGMFCAGEIGPVGSDTRLLGYTSSFGIFRDTVPDPAE